METPVLKYKVRPGTLDSGKEYEFKMAALLSLRCLRQDVSDLWMASNAEGVGAFDDLILQIKTTRHENITYMLQLKHQDKPRNILEREFLQPKGDFSLSKYFKDVDKLYDSIHAESDKELLINNLGKFCDVNFVLFTNRNVNSTNLLEEYSDACLSFIQTGSIATNTLYKFNIAHMQHLQILEKGKYSHIYLLPNQVSAKHIDKEIEEELVKVSATLELSFANIRNALDKYIKYITDWAKGSLGGHYGITRKDILSKLAELVLSRYEMDLSRQRSSNYTEIQGTCWDEIVRDHNAIIIESNNGPVVQFVLQGVYDEVKGFCCGTTMDTFSIEEQNRFYQDYPSLKASMLKIVGNTGKITVLDVYKCLWINNKCPVLLKITKKQDYDSIVHILNILRFNVIIFNYSTENISLYSSDIKPLCSLQDMDENHRKKILSQVVKLQGRAYAKLEDLVDESMYKYITCRDVIEILLNIFNIGPTLQPLPSYFIASSVRRLFLQPELLQEVTNEIFLVSNYSEKYRNMLQVEKSEVCRLEDIDYHNGNGIRIITIHQNSNLEGVNIQNCMDGTIHHVAIYDKHHLEWKWSSGSTNNIRPFLINLEKYDNNIERHFNNPTNIISEVAGMGKSILMDFIAQQAPMEKWVLRIDLNKHQRYYRSQYCKHSGTNACKHLNYFHQALLGQHQFNTQLTEMIFQKFVYSKNIIVLLDGFDEVSISYKDAVTNIVTSLHREEYHVWLTTRPHMKSYLEKEFGTFSISLKPFSLDDQQQFLVKYFTACNSSFVSKPEVVIKFSKNLLDVSRKNLLDKDAKFTGIPLQTQLLADFFNRKFKEHLLSGVAVNFNQHFDLLGLYQNFIDNKFNILCERFGEAAVDAHTVFKEHQSLFALQLVFRMDNFTGISIYRKRNEYYKNEANKIQVLQRDGIIMVDEEQNVTCIHRTFAEYLAANWLSNNFDSDDAEIKEFSHYLIQQRFSENHQFLFSIFDRLLANECPLHMAIINGNADNALNIVNSDPSATTIIDRGGRSVSHILALYGLQFPLAYKAAKVGDLQENHFTQDLVNYVTDYNNADIIGYTPLDYALSNRSLIIANKLYEKTRNCCINAYVNFNYKSDYLKYCIALKYMSLFKALLQSFVFRDLLLKEVSVNTTMEQYLHITICYPHYHKSNPMVSHFMSEFKDMGLLKYVSNYSNYCSDFRYVISFGANQSLTNSLFRVREINETDIDQNTWLHYAVLHCKPKLVEILLANNAVVDAQNKHGNTPLHLAFMVYNKTNIKLLLNKGANVNIANKNGETALHVATQVHKSGILSKVQFYGNRARKLHQLFSKGAKVNIPNNEGETPLHVAVKNNSQIAMAKLVKYGADINYQDCGGNTPLHLAIVGSHLSTAEKLVSYAADVNIKNNRGFAAHHYAVEKKCTSLVNKLLSKGAAINVQNKFGATPLHLASKEGYAEIIKILLAHGANLNLDNAKGETALHYATGKCRYKIATILLMNGIDVNKENDGGNTALHIALNREVYQVDMDVVRFLLAHGANINTGNCNGETILHIAAKYGNSSAINELVLLGAQVNRQDCDGHTPLHIALKVKRMGNIKVRISEYKSIDISNTETGLHVYNAANKCNYIVTKLLEEQDSDNPNTQLHLVSMKGHIESSRILISAGAQSNIGCNKGKTALHYAAENFYNDVLLELLAKGADVNQQDANGDSPLHLAFRKGHKSTAELLISNNVDVNIVNCRGFTAHRYAIHNSLRSALYPENGKSPLLYVPTLMRTSRPAYRLQKILMS